MWLLLSYRVSSGGCHTVPAFLLRKVCGLWSVAAACGCERWAEWRWCSVFGAGVCRSCVTLWIKVSTSVFLGSECVYVCGGMGARMRMSFGSHTVARPFYPASWLGHVLILGTCRMVARVARRAGQCPRAYRIQDRSRRSSTYSSDMPPARLGRRRKECRRMQSTTLAFT